MSLVLGPLMGSKLCLCQLMAYPRLSEQKLNDFDLKNNIDHVDMCAERAAVYNELGTSKVNYAKLDAA